MATCVWLSIRKHCCSYAFLVVSSSRLKVEISRLYSPFTFSSLTISCSLFFFFSSSFVWFSIRKHCCSYAFLAVSSSRLKVEISRLYSPFAFSSLTISSSLFFFFSSSFVWLSICKHCCSYAFLAVSSSRLKVEIS